MVFPRGRILAECAAVCGLGLLAAFWIIPAQTSGGGLGLNPAFLPTLCALVIAGLAVLDGAFRLAAPAPPHSGEEPSAWRAFIRLQLVALAAALALHVGGVAGCALVGLPAGMLALGEKQWLRIVLTTALGTAGLVLAFR